MRQKLSLVPFTREHLAVANLWFDDPETQKYLGGREWPRQMLDRADKSIGEVFRGQKTLATYRWVGQIRNEIVGYIDCGVSDVWTICERKDGQISVRQKLDGPAGAFALVVAPSQRRKGLGKALIKKMLNQPALKEVKLFGAGVNPNNVAMRQALESTGFKLQDPEPDWEGMLYYTFEK